MYKLMVFYFGQIIGLYDKICLIIWEGLILYDQNFISDVLIRNEDTKATLFFFFFFFVIFWPLNKDTLHLFTCLINLYSSILEFVKLSLDLRK
jgi:hypothetical protein